MKSRDIAFLGPHTYTGWRHKQRGTTLSSWRITAQRVILLSLNGGLRIYWLFVETESLFFSQAKETVRAAEVELTADWKKKREFCFLIVIWLKSAVTNTWKEPHCRILGELTQGKRFTPRAVRGRVQTQTCCSRKADEQRHVLCNAFITVFWVTQQSFQKKPGGQKHFRCQDTRVWTNI